MFLVMAAVVSGWEGWQEIEGFRGTNKLDWLRTDLCRRHPNPSPICPHHQSASLSNRWYTPCLPGSMPVAKPAGQSIIAIDGKTIRGQSNQHN